MLSFSSRPFIASPAWRPQLFLHHCKRRPGFADNPHMKDAPAPLNLHAMILCGNAVADPVTRQWCVLNIFERWKLPSFPATVPPFFVYIEISELRPNTAMNMQVVDASGEVIFPGQETTIGNPAPDTLAQCGIQLTGVKVESPGLYTVRLTANRQFVAERRLWFTL
jgi:hypothetical protein